MFLWQRLQSYLKVKFRSNTCRSTSPTFSCIFQQTWLHSVLPKDSIIQFLFDWMVAWGATVHILLLCFWKAKVNVIIKGQFRHISSSHFSQSSFIKLWQNDANQVLQSLFLYHISARKLMLYLMVKRQVRYFPLSSSFIIMMSTRYIIIYSCDMLLQQRLKKSWKIKSKIRHFC